jgi:hypothetical protein
VGDTHVFVSYRRQDTRYVARLLYERLSERFGSDRIFMDVDSVRAGVDFVKAIEDAVEASDVLLALIGSGWAGAIDETGRRRLDDPTDWVVLELKAALERDIHVIPVLVDDAPMPNLDELPPALVPLVRRNAFRLGYERFVSDAKNLIEIIDDRPQTRRGALAKYRTLMRRRAAHITIAVLVVAATVAAVWFLPGFGQQVGGGADQSAPGVIKVNFQSPDAAVPEGFLPDFGQPYGPRIPGPGQESGLTYGWVHEGTTEPLNNVGQGRDRDMVSDQRIDTLVHMEGWDPAVGRVVPAAWEIAVPPGRYAASVSVGDQALNSRNTINVEGVTAIKDFRGTEAVKYEENTVEVEVNDGRLTIDSIGGENTKINYAVVRPL